MRFRSVAGIAVVAVFTFVNGINAQACAAGVAQEINGNWYCSKVSAITYKNFPGHGYYNKVTDMDETTGQCTSQQYNYSGSLSPLNEELSLHIRGPTWLKQVAVYTLDASVSASKKRIKKRSTHDHRHGGHQYLHKRQGEMEEVTQHDHQHGHKKARRSVGQLVTATIDGQIVSWTNVYAGPGVSTTLPSPVGVELDEVNASTPEETTASYAPIVTVSMTATMSSAASSLAAASVGKASIAMDSTAAASTSEASAPVSSGSWARQAYYNAADGTTEGITFLNHFGGANGIPGTSAGGPAFGASLSYASSDGQSGAVTAQTLSNAVIEDDVEVIIMSDKSCDDGECGYTRPGGVAYHGFSGSRKVFLLEFSMPMTNRTGFNADMPAIWLLNAQIPLTSQYGENPDCSCWTSGCGEFDLFEVLDSSNFRCKSTLHMAPAGGSSDWFQRPTGDSITAAIVFAGNNEVAAIRVLNQEQSFGESLSGTVVNGWVEQRSSTFNMAN